LADSYEFSRILIVIGCAKQYYPPNRFLNVVPKVGGSLVKRAAKFRSTSRNFVKFVMFAIAVISCQTSWALPVSHTPASGSNPAPFTPPFGAFTPGNEAGNRYIDFGVDYTNAAAVAVFNDPPPAFGGVNGSGIVDLLAPVNGRIVLLGTTTQGVTSSLTVTAGSADSGGTLLLEVFDVNNALLDSEPNPVGGFSAFGITRSSPDIAYFRVSTTSGDTFGVDEVTIESPVAIPEPATVLLAACFGLFALPMRGMR
jgi:hypothetical protein